MRPFFKNLQFAATLILLFGTIQPCFAQEKIKLIYQRIWESEEVFEPMIQAYEREHPNVDIEYHQIPYQQYKNTLKPALEAGVGPDMFEIHSSWLPHYISELAHIPGTVYTIGEYSSDFHDLVARSFISRGKIWAIALDANTLALFYNKDIFEEAGLNPNYPPRSWDELVEYSVTIKKKTGKWGAAIGTAYNTPQDHNILEMFAVQRGAYPVSDNLTKSLVNMQEFVKAMQFYTDFVLKHGVWSPSAPPGDAAFVNGDVGMVINGSWLINSVLSANMNAGTANVPQYDPSQPYTHATFWGEVVSADCKRPEIAWDFLKFCANRRNMTHFFQQTKRPPSRRDLLSVTAENPQVRVLIAPFINQAVYAGQQFKPWEDDWRSSQLDAIEAVIHGGKSPQEALDIASEKETVMLLDYKSKSKSEFTVTKIVEREKVTAGDNEDLYTVIPGDNLRRIALLYYEDENKWQKIYERNVDRIIDPAYIYNGQVLIIPKN
ncbi:MAG: hypothetical protein B6244_02075 [Candidatus Cloacimonetes bacterium 4572_55]|nr:MAG: hypothetical protein B6244_02075 [Candidatus Cloacimonetes bacterium 4572_55]